MAIPLKYQAKEVLNKVLNAGEDALNVDLADSVTVTVDSEFPAAAAITDNFANPTTTSAMSMLMGYDGSAWDRVTIGGGTEAAALRVTIASDSTGVVSVDDGGGALTVDGTVTANLSATDNAVLDAVAASLSVLDDWDDSNYANVNMNLAGSDAQAGEGTISATTQRVTIATDDDGVAHLATIAGDTTSVDGKITACNTGAVVLAASDGTDIGDVDVASVPAPLNVVGGGTEAAALRVTMANNSTGVVSVDDGGGALTVDGTVTANLSATDNAVLDTIDAVLDTIKTDTGTIDSDTDAIKTATESSNTHLGNMLYGTALVVDYSGGDHSLGATYEAFYIGVGGDLSLDCVNGAVNVVFKNLASGQLLPVRATVVNQSGTDATNIVALKA